MTTFAHGRWGAPDATFGLIPGSVIEDFEDTSLAAGLQVLVNASNGSYGPTSNLPAVFDPAGDLNPILAFHSYPCGVPANCSSVWDGARSLINTYTNQAMNYNAAGNWGDIELLFADGASQVGFSLQQNELSVTVFVNGSQVAAINGTPGGRRAGYFRLDVTEASAPITSLRLSNNNSGDGWAIDHVAFTSAVPESSTPATWLAGIGVLFALRRRLTATT